MITTMTTLVMMNAVMTMIKIMTQKGDTDKWQCYNAGNDDNDNNGDNDNGDINNMTQTVQVQGPIVYYV